MAAGHEPARGQNSGHHHWMGVQRVVSLKVQRRLYISALLLALVGTALFALTTASVVQDTWLAGADEPVRNWLLTLRTPVFTTVMAPVAFVFGPVAMPIVVLVVTLTWALIARNAWRPLMLAGAMLAGVVISQIILPIVQRPRPPAQAMLLGPDGSYSFPSGHVLGACDFLLVTAFLVLSRRKTPLLTSAICLVAVLGISLVTLSRLYLGYHWLTDAIASVSLSLVILGSTIALDTRHTTHTPRVPTKGTHARRNGAA